MEAEQLFKALSDPTRLRCLALLAQRGELCVCELTHALALPQPKISHHLAALRRARVVSDRKQGLWIYYRVDEQLPRWAVEVIEATVRGLQTTPPYRDDTRTLDTMPDRPGNICSA